MRELQRSPKILVVDDGIANRQILTRILLQRGFDVVEAQGGIRALELIEEQHFDLMLLDIMMPDLSGIDVLQKVRQSRSEIDLPIVMVSAQNAADNVIRCLNLGANDYIAKPVDLPVMLARIQTQLVRKQGAEQYRQERMRVVEYAAKLHEQSEALLQLIRNLSKEPVRGGDLEHISSHIGPDDVQDSNDCRDTRRRRRTFKSAKIVLNGRKSVIDCIIWESFDGGAILRVESEAGVPDEFELAVENKPLVDCCVDQRGLNELLVRFLR